MSVGAPGCLSGARTGPAVPVWLDPEGIPVSHRWDPLVAFRDGCWLAHVVHPVAHPFTPRGLLIPCPGATGGTGALGWFDRGRGLVCGISPSAWSRLATGLPERQMVAAWGPAIHPSG